MWSVPFSGGTVQYSCAVMDDTRLELLGTRSQSYAKTRRRRLVMACEYASRGRVVGGLLAWRTGRGRLLNWCDFISSVHVNRRCAACRQSCPRSSVCLCDVGKVVLC